MRNNTNFFFKKKVLVTGGSGMIGRQLVNLLVNCGAKVTVVAMDDIVNIVYVDKVTSGEKDIFLTVAKSKKGWKAKRNVEKRRVERRNK